MASKMEGLEVFSSMLPWAITDFSYAFSIYRTFLMSPLGLIIKDLSSTSESTMRRSYPLFSFLLVAELPDREFN